MLMKPFTRWLVVALCLSAPLLHSQDISSGLVAHYPFRTNALDASGNGYDGDVDGPVLVRDRFDQQNEAYLFDGNDDIILIEENIANFNSFTVSAWVYVEDFDPSAGNSRFASIFLTPYLSIERATGKVAAFVYGVNDQNNDDYYLSNATIPLDEWTFVAATYDATNDEYSLYINDEQVREFNKPGTPEINLISIGGEPNGRRFFNGIIDDLRLYDRALGETDLDCLRNLDVSGNCATTNLAAVPEPSSLQVYPNPAQDQVHLRLPPLRHTADLRVLRMDGREVLRRSVAPQTDLVLASQSWAAGAYLIRLQTQDSQYHTTLWIE